MEDPQIEASTPPKGINSTQILFIGGYVLLIFSLISAFVLIDPIDAFEISIKANIIKAWEFGFTLALGYFLGSSAESKNKQGTIENLSKKEGK